MMNNSIKIKRLVVLLAALPIVALTGGPAMAGDGCCSSKAGGGGGAAAPSCHASPQAAQPRAEDAFQPPHGGQLTKRLWNFYEVAYGPQETRIYLYDVFRYPVSARGIQGGVVMRVRSSGRDYRFPVRYVSDGSGQDYLAIDVNLTRVDDGDMEVFFDLANLPNRDEPTIRFAQTFAVAGPPSPMGIPGGIQRLGKPQMVVAQETRPNNRATRQPRITVAKATAADTAAIRLQKMCPVMKQPLGDHGAPTKISIDGRALFVCCDGCVDTVKENPGMYLAQAGR